MVGVVVRVVVIVVRILALVAGIVPLIIVTKQAHKSRYVL